MRRYGILCIAAALACNAPEAVGLDQEFTLALGEHAQVAGAPLTITFAAIPSDSRCPLGVECISAGNAEVVLLIHDADPPLSLLARVTLNTTTGPSQTVIFGYDVKLVSLTPLTTAGPPQPYRAGLVVQRSAQ